MKKKLNCVLLVDDDDATNFLNRKVIQKAGIAQHVETTLNGSEAIEYLTNKGKYEKSADEFPNPDLILLDINMPIMDGWKFLSEYKKLDDSRKSKMTIIMLTSSDDSNDRRRASEIEDVAEYKNKPLFVKNFDEILEKHFSDYL